MRRVTVCLVVLGFASACGTTNHLDKYPLKYARIVILSSIDPVAVQDGNDESSGSFFVDLVTAILVVIFTPHPDATMRDPSIGYYFEEGFRPELDSVLLLNETDTAHPAECELLVRITDCDLHENDSCCDVRFTETLHIAQIVTHATIFDESRTIEAPLRYCGSTEDSVSYSGFDLTKDSYQRLTPEEQLSALQCAAVAAGIRLADTLANFCQRASAHRN